MKTVYWRLARRGVGYWDVEFWTKQDQSNKITEKFVTTSEERLRYRVEQLMGLKNFELVQIKDK